MIAKWRVLTAAASVAALCACASPPNIPTAALTEEIGPTPAPGAARYAMKDLASGEIEEISIEITPEGYHGVSSTGCVWTESERYSPSLAWQSCGGSDGFQTISSEEGALWPLVVGNEKTWRFSGRNERGDTWSAARTCKVESAETVTLPAGDSNVLKVVCEDPWARRTYWHSPELGVPVYWQKFDKRRNDYETTAYVAAES